MNPIWELRQKFNQAWDKFLKTSEGLPLLPHFFHEATVAGRCLNGALDRVFFSSSKVRAQRDEHAASYTQVAEMTQANSSKEACADVLQALDVWARAC